MKIVTLLALVVILAFCALKTSPVPTPVETKTFVSNFENSDIAAWIKQIEKTHIVVDQTESVSSQIKTVVIHYKKRN